MKSNPADRTAMDAGQPAAKRTKRQLQAMETKDKIYNAALKEINEKGFGNVSVEDITTAANVAKGTFYTHFESKEALVFYTFQCSDEIYKQAYERVKGQDFLYMVTHFVRISYTAYEKRGKGIIKAMISNYFTMPGRSFYGRDRALLQCLSEIVESGKTERVLDTAYPTERYVDILLSTMIGVEVMWCFDSQELSLADLIEEAVLVVAKGMMQ
ncbi:TetR/AcrR family transcriptional regulator [Butyricicoccus faecihominis]|uniref:TetR/AcrR family transcriptional regulator n=1 Tax=Butyricicoccaceae TaxID=3085642 RepID=UPI002478DAB3|nr:MULTISPECIES: TetR/AcrR family transcriptional regulator [Butyricicoccaceae]MCQ5131165.1 TetR/AcrR family transcriptional regulator [Butyricicoccus faecihominis]WNX84341.1 TetR/AcrR family transcriptional regulator [Agathobaculum sp. NTUH-O15-33]